MIQMIISKVVHLNLLLSFLPKWELSLLPLVIKLRVHLSWMFLLRSFLIMLLLLSFYLLTLSFKLNLIHRIYLLWYYYFQSEFLQLSKVFILLSLLLLKYLLFRLILWLGYLQKFIWNIIFLNLISLEVLIFILILILFSTFLIF